MGVRFECPAGHKLHVKAHLAGQRGICPECGVRFIVPNFSGGRVAEAPAGSGSSGSNRFVSVSLESSDSFAAGLDQAAAGLGPASGGDVAWFVRPASGGQFGPVDTAAFQQWVSEGRVAGDSWVWRTGWSDWMSAGEALRMLAAESSRLAPPLPSQRSGNSLPHRGGAPSRGAARRSAPAASIAPAAPAFDLGDDETDDLLAAPQNGSAQEFLPAPISPARAEVLRRRKANQRLTLVLAGLTLVMVTAAIIVFATRGGGEAAAEGDETSVSASVAASDADDSGSNADGATADTATDDARE